MCSYKVFVLFIMVLLSISRVNSVASEQNVTRIAFEELLTKLEHLQNKLVDMESERKVTDRKILSAINKLNRNFTAFRKQSNKNQTILDLKLSYQEKLSAKFVSILNQLSKNISAQPIQSTKDRELINQKLSGFVEQLLNETQNLATMECMNCLKNNPTVYFRNVSFTSCNANPWKLSGSYSIQPIGYTKHFLGYCEQSVFGGGWLVFQHRYDGSLDFYRNWTEFRNGFGTVVGEFWLGLENLHRMTSVRRHELLVELKDFDGRYKYARYSDFEIGSEAEEYSLKKLGSYSGTAGDSFTFRGMKFTTKDRDNDPHGTNCANWSYGAWWHKACTNANLNGLYQNAWGEKTMFWYEFNDDYVGLAYSRMSIRGIS